jgi:uncharacterized protein YabN with tetrapyrrole methylase and pyrophosphatase domain
MNINDDSALVALCSLKQAEDIQADASVLGFDWKAPAPVFEKVSEELIELQEAFAQGNTLAQVDELGDLLFAVVNVARHLGISSDVALKQACDKFTSRFERVKSFALEEGTCIKSAELDHLDRLWALAKQKENPIKGE